MKIDQTDFEGLYIIDSFSSDDIRGSFTKCFSSFKNKKFQLAETYYSVNKKDVIRGLHFQNPPFEHQKIVHVIKGAVMDVVIDLRPNSNTFRKVFNTELSENNKKALFIEKGFAHGFRTLEDNTIMLYMVSSVFNDKHDDGIHYQSIGFDWDIEDPIVSKRDNELSLLDDFIKNNPFI